MSRSLAVIASVIVPGLGQILTGKAKKGLAFLLLVSLPLGLLGWLYYAHVYRAAFPAFGPIDTYLSRLHLLKVRYAAVAAPFALGWAANVLDCAGLHKRLSRRPRGVLAQ